jgi:hypothetical protein
MEKTSCTDHEKNKEILHRVKDKNILHINTEKGWPEWTNLE